MKAIRIPKFVDDPAQIMIFEIDEVIVMTMLFGLGIILEKLFVMMIIMVVVWQVFKRVKMSSHRGLLQHTAFWYGFDNFKWRFGNSFNRYFGG